VETPRAINRSGAGRDAGVGQRLARQPLVNELLDDLPVKPLDG
jgi:hypothetical protein